MKKPDHTQEKASEQENFPIFKLFLAGLPSSANKTDVVMAMQDQYRFVPLRDIKIPKKQNLGFAYLEINTEEGYNHLLEARFLNIKGRKVLMKPFEKGSSLGKFKNGVN
jgi:hypothetical protein